MDEIKQQAIETVQSYNVLFRQQLNEVKYTVQNDNTGMERILALQIEDKAAIKKYIMNLKEEIGSQVRPLKTKIINDVQREELEAEVWYKEKQQTRARSQILVKIPIHQQLQHKKIPTEEQAVSNVIEKILMR